MANTVEYEHRIAQRAIAFYSEPRVSYLIERRRKDKFLGVFQHRWDPVRKNEWVTATGVGSYAAAPSAYYPAEYDTLHEAMDSIKKPLTGSLNPMYYLPTLTRRVIRSLAEKKVQTSTRS